MSQVSARRSVLVAFAAAVAAVGAASACSAAGEEDEARDADASVQVPSPEAAPPAADATDAVAEAAPDTGSACVDCAFFPPACSSALLCPIKVPVQPAAEVTGIGGTSSSDVWAAGVKGTVLHFDGTTWTADLSAPAAPFTQIWPLSATEVVAASTLSILYSRSPQGDAGVADGGAGSAWGDIKLRPVNFEDGHVNSVFAAPGATWIWMAITAEPYVQSYNGMNVRRVKAAAVGARHDMQKQFECIEPCPEMTRIHGASKNELWAVGGAGTAIRITNADAANPIATELDSRTFQTLYGVWASPAGDVWAVGVGGTIRHYTGSPLNRFEIVASPVTTTLRSIWGTSPNDVWAVGDGGVVIHYDGSAWKRVPVGGLLGRPDLRAVWAAAPDKVWVVGRGILLGLGGGAP